MIITKDFVVLNLPKTGSTFVRRVLKKLYYERKNKNIAYKILLKLKIIKPAYKELLMPHSSIPNYNDQHGTYFQIPKKYNNKIILSVLRNPYERFESQYTFRWWVNYPGIEKEVLNKLLPKFPNLSIDEYVIMRKIQNEKIKKKIGLAKELNIGDQTIQFINMFFKDPKKTFEKLNLNYMNSDEFENDIADIKFLRQENLNNELSCFLKENGFKQSELDFVINHKRENVSSTNKKLLNNDAIEFIKDSEWFLFKMIEKYGFIYDYN